MLEDGEYDVIVVDADAEAAGGGTGGGGARLEVTVLTGPHKGEVVSLRAEGLDGDPVDLLGLPGTLTVSGGRPSIALDR